MPRALKCCVWGFPAAGADGDGCTWDYWNNLHPYFSLPWTTVLGFLGQMLNNGRFNGLMSGRRMAQTWASENETAKSTLVGNSQMSNAFFFFFCIVIIIFVKRVVKKMNYLCCLIQARVRPRIPEVNPPLDASGPQLPGLLLQCVVWPNS